MKLARDPETAEWLWGLAGDSGDFDWDVGNRTKNRKHGVEAAEVEQLVRRPYVVEGRIVEPRHDEPRWLALGCNEAGRHLALVFTRRGSRVRPLSCRPMRRKEKQRYEQAIRKQEGDPGTPGA
jgi:hypothetical protein